MVHHVDGARRRAGQQVGPLQRCASAREPAGAGQQQPPARCRQAPVSAGRQATPHRVAAAAHALHAVVQADGGGLRGAIVARQRRICSAVMPQTCGRALGGHCSARSRSASQPSVWRAM
jgi:hypothetical protein